MPRSNPIRGVSLNPLSHLATTVEYRTCRAALVRELIHAKPTTRERGALDTAALLLTRAQFAATDLTVSADALVKINAAARRAQELLEAIAEERHSRRRSRGGKLPTAFDGYDRMRAL
jgi:hypothetical protein